MLFRIKRDEELCIGCGKCEGYWRGIIRRFNGAGYFDVEKEEFVFRQHEFEWAKNLCPGDAISMETVHEKSIPAEQETL